MRVVVLKPRGLVALLTLLFILIALPFVIARRNNQSAPPVPAGPSPAERSSNGTINAAAPPNAPAAADGNLLREENWRFYTERTARAFQEQVPDAPAGSAGAYRFSVEQTGGQDWNVGFNNKLRGVSLAPGDKVRLRFRARSSSRSTLVLLLQRDVAPYPHSWKKYVRLEPEWKAYEYVLPAGTAYADGEGLLAFFMGMNVGKIDLADIRLERA